MAQTIKINGVTYEAKQIDVPLASDASKVATFHDTTDAGAKTTSVKDGEWFYADGKKQEGTMPVNGAVNGTISTKDGTVSVPEGYTPGGTVGIASTEKEKLIPNNIRQGVTVLGVSGTMSPSEGVNAQSKAVTPTKSEQVVQPDSGYTHLAQVTVAAIPAAYITTTDANAIDEDIKAGKTAYVNGKKVTGKHTDPVFSLANGVLTIS
jgi:hypothetical protein